MLKILIIEDNIVFRDQLQTFLTATGFVVAVADTVGAAIMSFRDAPSDFIITDMFLPDTIGLKVIQEINNNCPNIPVIAMSGGDPDSHIDLLPLSEKMNVKRAICKPFDFKELADSICDYLRIPSNINCQTSASVPSKFADEEEISESAVPGDSGELKSNVNEKNSVLFDTNCENIDISDVNDFAEQFDKDNLESLLLSVESTVTEHQPEKDAIVQEMFREVHSLKGTACFLKLPPIINVLKYLEDGLGTIRAHIHEINGVVERRVFDVMFRSLDLVDILLAELRTTYRNGRRKTTEIDESYRILIHTIEQVKQQPTAFFEIGQLNEGLF